MLYHHVSIKVRLKINNGPNTRFCTCGGSRLFMLLRLSFPIWKIQVFSLGRGMFFCLSYRWQTLAAQNLAKLAESLLAALKSSNVHMLGHAEHDVRWAIIWIAILGYICHYRERICQSTLGTYPGCTRRSANTSNTSLWGGTFREVNKMSKNSFYYKTWKRNEILQQKCVKQIVVHKFVHI